MQDICVSIRSLRAIVACDDHESQLHALIYCTNEARRERVRYEMYVFLSGPVLVR